MKLKIEKGIKLPPKRWRREDTQVIVDQIEPMEVGDSFTTTEDTPYPNLYTKWKRIFRHAGYKMTSRKENGHIRIWRVE